MADACLPVGRYTIRKLKVIITCPPWRMSRSKGKDIKPEMLVYSGLSAFSFS
jgi:hypothetical protein